MQQGPLDIRAALLFESEYTDRVPAFAAFFRDLER
jgi:hypothetical protein